jgi:hypothetical protein
VKHTIKKVDKPQLEEDASDDYENYSPSASSSSSEYESGDDDTQEDSADAKRKQDARTRARTAVPAASTPKADESAMLKSSSKSKLVQAVLVGVVEKDGKQMRKTKVTRRRVKE